MPVSTRRWSTNETILAEHLNKIEENLQVLQREKHEKITEDSPLKTTLGGTGISNNKGIYISRTNPYVASSVFDIENPFSSPVCVQVFSTLNGCGHSILKLVDASRYQVSIIQTEYGVQFLRFVFQDQNGIDTRPFEPGTDGVVYHNYYQVLLLGYKGV